MKEITLNSIRSVLDKNGYMTCLCDGFNGSKMIHLHKDSDVTICIAIIEYYFSPSILVNGYDNKDGTSSTRMFYSIDSLLDYIK